MPASQGKRAFKGMRSVLKMIYLDNAATTKPDPKVVEAMLPYLKEKFGNASSAHRIGQEAKMALDDARKVIARSINAKADEIVFTSGGTESNNLALKGVLFANKEKGNHIITTKIEHSCILNASKWLETKGYKVTYLNVDKEGFVNPADLEKTITKQTVLFSVIHGNNEIGTVQNLEELGKICKKHNVLFHTDACQSYTKVPIDVNRQHLDLVTLNAHKIHGPKGVGALYIRSGIKITPIAHGGGQEKYKRGGTENIPGIVGFAESVKIASSSNVRKMEKLRDILIDGILETPGAKLNGPRKNRLCNNINFSFAGVEGEAVGSYLDSSGIYVSTGSACSSASLEPSHVLLAIGLKPEEAHGSLRFSISKYTTEEEIDRVLELLPKILQKLRKISPIEKLIRRL